MILSNFKSYFFIFVIFLGIFSSVTYKIESAQAITYAEIVADQTGKVLGASTPALPQVYIDTTYSSAVSGTCNTTVPNGGDVQAVIDGVNQNSNYVICLQAGGTFGAFSLRNKSGSGWITIRTSTPDAQLPSPGNRINPSNASLLAKILPTGYNGAISADSSAHNYRLIGLEVTTPNTATAYTVYNLIEVGNVYTDNTDALTPIDIVIDRSYIHGAPTGNIRRGVALNGRRISVIDSYISDIHEVGSDSQAVAGWNGSGPFKIVNNYLEGAAENIMFGGSMPAVANLVPSDIEIRNNYVFKPLKWKVGDPSYAGIHWTIKNLLELKSARRVLIDGNIFENNWYADQRGNAMVLSVRTTQGGSQAVVEDITLTNNILKRIPEVLSISGYDYDDPARGGFTRRVLFKNNLFDKTAWSSDCCTYQIIVQNRTQDLEFNHNTFIEDSVIGSNIDTEGTNANQNSNIVFTNNIFPNYVYGIAANYNPTTCSNCVLSKNIFAASDSNGNGYPGNFFTSTWSAVGMVNRNGGDYSLANSSIYKNAGSDNLDPGADMSVLNSVTANTLTGGSNSVVVIQDTTPPINSSIAVSSITQTSATVSWSTNEQADTQVEYGTSLSYGQSSVLNQSLVSSHSVNLTALSSSTLYHFRVRSRDSAGNLSISSDQVFTTSAPQVSANPSLNTTTANFGSILVNSSTESVPFVLSNPTDVQLGVSGVSVTGDFAIKNNLCSSGVLPGGNCSVYVAFTPTNPGTRSGALVFTIGNATLSTLQVSLYGAGLVSPTDPIIQTPTIPSIPTITTSGVVVPNSLKDGDIVKFQSSATVYIVKTDGLHPFDTYGSLLLYQTSSGRPVVINNSSETNFTISPVFARQILGQSITLPSQFPTGSLINDNGTIYFIVLNNKIPFTSFSVFEKLGYKLKNVINGSTDSYHLAEKYFLNNVNMVHPWSSWLLDGGVIYYSSQQGMIPVPSMDVFNLNGGDISKVLIMNSEDAKIEKIRIMLPADPYVIR